MEEYRANLERLKNIYKDLLALAKRKEEILLNHDWRGLEALVCVEEKLVYQAGIAERARIESHARLSATMGLSERELTAERLKREFAGDGHLSALIDDLETTVDLLLHQNDLNGELISSSLSYVDFMLKVIAEAKGGVQDPAPTYGSDGRTSTANKDTVRLLDTKR